MHLRTIASRLASFCRARTLQVAVAPVLICLAAGVGEGAVIINISDDGTNLTMSATGDYDLTNATPNPSGTSGLSAAIIIPGSTGLYGWNTGGQIPLYLATFSGTLSGNRVNFSSSSTTNPFFFSGMQQSAAFTGGLTGSVNESATLFNNTLADFGFVAGQSISVSWGNGGVNERGTVNVLSNAVPEPSTFTLLGLAGAGGLLALRLRRRAT